jgi:hypothetical protein
MTMGTVRVCLCAATVHESGARLVALPQPSQFNHYSPKPTVAGLADPLFAFNATTVEGSCGQACVRSERFAISKAANKRLAHEHGRALCANAAQRGEMLSGALSSSTASRCQPKT